MNAQKIKAVKCKPYTKEDFERDSRRNKRTTVIGVDFQKIENAPRTDLEMGIQKKIANAPSAGDLLIKDEERAFLLKILESDLLPKSENLCIRLTLEGSKPRDIARKLNIDEVTFYGYLKRAVGKIKRHLKHRKID